MCSLVLACWSLSSAQITNQPPVARALVNGQTTVTIEAISAAGAAVTLDGSQSSDPDGGSLTYAWDFNRDGVTDAADAVMAHTFPRGVHSPQLTVTDLAGATATATVSVTVQDTTAPVFMLPMTSTELGQTVVGYGSANFAWLRNPGYRFGVAFKAPRSGTLSEITLQWKTSTNYGQSSYGIYTFQVCESTPEFFPSTSVIGETTGVTPATAMDGKADGAFHFPITAVLQEGKIYHLVVINTHPNPSTNWSSPNTLMTEVVTWDGTGCRGEYRDDAGVWHPWSSVDNAFNTTGKNDINGSHCPLLLKWDDGSVTGDPYYSSAISAGAYSMPTVTPDNLSPGIIRRLR